MGVGFLEHILEDNHIEPEAFYSLVDSLRSLDYIGEVRPRIQYRTGGVGLECDYRGSEVISSPTSSSERERAAAQAAHAVYGRIGDDIGKTFMQVTAGYRASLPYASVSLGRGRITVMLREPGRRSPRHRRA